jgi:hypothetical protein
MNTQTDIERFQKLLQKRKTLTATIFEEEELIELSKRLPPEVLKGVQPEMLTYSNEQRLDNIASKLDELLKHLSK